MSHPAWQPVNPIHPVHPRFPFYEHIGQYSYSHPYPYPYPFSYPHPHPHPHPPPYPYPYVLPVPVPVSVTTTTATAAVAASPHPYLKLDQIPLADPLAAPSPDIVTTGNLQSHSPLNLRLKLKHQQQQQQPQPQPQQQQQKHQQLKQQQQQQQPQQPSQPIIASPKLDLTQQSVLIPPAPTLAPAKPNEPSQPQPPPQYSIEALLAPAATLHPEPRLHYDLRAEPTTVRISARDPPPQDHQERYLARAQVRRMLSLPVSQPSLKAAKIISTHFPWTIDVAPLHHGTSIVVEDILATLHNFFNHRIDHNEWNGYPRHYQDAILRSWKVSVSDTTGSTAGIRKFFRRKTTSSRTIVQEDSILPPVHELGYWDTIEVDAIEAGKGIQTRDPSTGVLKIDCLCGKTRWRGLVRDDVLAKRRGIPEDSLGSTWSLLLE